MKIKVIALATFVSAVFAEPVQPYLIRPMTEQLRLQVKL